MSNEVGIEYVTNFSWGCTLLLNIKLPTDAARKFQEKSSSSSSDSVTESRDKHLIGHGLVR